MRKVDYEEVAIETCLDKSQHQSDDKLICGAKVQDEKEEENDDGVCYVGLDAGSPLLCQTGETDRFEISGMVTKGINCPKYDEPAFFTDVAQYTHWIRERYRKNAR